MKRLDNMNGCNNCKHKKSQLVWLEDNSKSVMIHDCKLGFKDKTNIWWNNNGHKREESELDSMDCFEETDSMKSLNSMNEILDKMLNIINK
jgi:hypothetical protein